MKPLEKTLRQLAGVAVVVMALIITIPVKGQWGTNGTHIYFNTGNVGIGTEGPSSKLEVNTGASNGSGETIGLIVGNSNGRIVGDAISSVFQLDLTYGAKMRVTATASNPGLVDPRVDFLINNNGWSSPLLTIKHNGNVGIGTSSPVSLGAGTNLHVYHPTGNTYVIAEKGSGAQTVLGNGFATEIGAEIGFVGTNDATSFSIRTNNQDRIYIKDINGNVGIGTTTATEKLTVNGKILAEEVQVVVDVLPDYVFKEDYKLMSLAELDKFIKANKHLPEVPSEKEVCDNGSKIGLGEMNHILLKKIEELTLYTIEQENNIKEQDEVIQSLLKRVTELEKQ